MNGQQNNNNKKWYFSSNNITVISPRRMRWVGHVARAGREEMRRGF